MSVGSAIFKVFASLVWGIGAICVVWSVKTEGAQGGWFDLLLSLGLFGLLQGFSFVSFIMATFNRSAEESANTIEETIWFDRFGNEVRRETDAGSGCLMAVFIWIFGIILTLVASAVIAPVVFAVNLCRAAHRFCPKGLAVVLDLLILAGTFVGTCAGIGIASRAIHEREEVRRQEAAQYQRESEARAEQARVEREAQMERDRAEREARQAREQAEREAKEAECRAERQLREQRRQVERQAREQQRQVERAQREIKMQQRKAAQQVERARKAAEAEQRRALQQAERERKNALRKQNRGKPQRRNKNIKLPF